MISTGISPRQSPPTTDLRIGIDLGGTKIEGVVVRLGGESPQVLCQKRLPTERERGYAHILATVAQLIDSVAAAAGLDPAALPPIGVGMPGSINRDGLIKNSNTTCLNGRPFRQDLTARIGQRVSHPIGFANDANCFALAEARYGSGRGYRLAFGVILGTGVGGGIVLPGPDGGAATTWDGPHGIGLPGPDGGAATTWDGPHGIAGEWGHISLDPVGGPPCYCGRRGCVETYLCGPALEADYARRSGQALTVAEIAQRRHSGDPLATASLDSAVASFGRAVATVVNILDPEVIILGGGVSNLDLWYSDGPAAVRRYIFGDEFTTPIVRHQLGDSAGVIGAALLPG